ncbi:MAG: class I SAM-dependent methyltransferase [Candidatus Daviesbacteria bacterium]|nr:class I SAM-dependent methyltransferase [Candidatus Daviesbacteria bacterium]
MNKIKNFYDQFWSEDKGEFGRYIRNSYLPQFFKKGELVLDVGCGDGVIADYLQRNVNVKVIGIDISEEAIKKARNLGIEAKVLNSEDKFPFKDNTFDAVFWGDNIEHLFNPTSCAKEIKRVLKKDGRLILSCPNMGYWRYKIKYLISGSLADTEWTGLKPWEWSHIRFFNLKILKDFLFSCDFEKITKVLGVSERRLDKPFLAINPSFFGMILILEVV